jgi:hypothetical protein
MAARLESRRPGFSKSPAADFQNCRYRGSMKPFFAPFRVAALLLTCLPFGTQAAEVAPRFPPLPTAVTSFGAVADAGSIFLYGGHQGTRHEYSAADVSGACYRLELRPGATWETLPAGIPAQSPGIALHEGHLYRVGGMAARNAKGAKADLYSHASASRLNLATRQWENLPDLPAARSSHDAWVVGDQLYVVGGWRLAGGSKEAGWHDTWLRLDLKDKQPAWKSAPQPFQRRGLCVAAVGTRLYSLGGMEASESPTLAVEVLDTVTGTWSHGPSLPAGRLKGFGNSACVVDGRLYVSGMSGIVWRLKNTSDGWEEAGRLQTPRFFHRILPGLPGSLLVLGGEGDEGKLKDIEVVQPTPPKG